MTATRHITVKDADVLLLLGTRIRMLTAHGELRPHVNVNVGEENIRQIGGLNMAIPDGEEISILPAVSGGAVGHHGMGNAARRD